MQPTAQLIQGDESLEMSVVIRPVAKEKKKKKQKGEPVRCLAINITTFSKTSLI